MLIKTLIGLDLKEPRSIRELVSDGDVTLRKPIFIKPNQKVETLLKMFLQGKSHMAIISNDPTRMDDYIKNFQEYGGDLSLFMDEEENENNKETNDYDPPEVLGLLTLEDLIEYIIKEDILDEADYDQDLIMNRNPNISLRERATPKMSSIFAQNRDKLKGIVEKEINTNLKNRKKSKLLEEYTKSFNLSFKDLATPLIDKEKDKEPNVFEKTEPEEFKDDSKDDQA